MNTRAMTINFLKVWWIPLLFIIFGIFVCITQSYAQKNTKGRPSSRVLTQERIAILELKNNASSKISKGEIEFLTNEIRNIVNYLPRYGVGARLYLTHNLNS